MSAESLGWLAPAPLWGGAVGVESPELLQPFLVELGTDQFVARFLALVGAKDGASPADIGTMGPETTADGTLTGPYRLFHPLSQRYYLVTASLVCRRVGIPDRQVKPAAGETATFVIRRLAADGSEEAWVPSSAAADAGGPPSGSWQPAVGGQLTTGEEQHRMHAAPVAAFADPGTTAATFGMDQAGRRTVFYGYLPATRRDRMVTPLADPVAALAAVDPSGKENPTLGDLVGRVIEPWKALRDAPPAGSDTDYASLYVLLDLGDWLHTNLPAVHDALVNGTTLSGAAEALRAAIAGVSVSTRPPPSEQPPPPGWSPGAPTGSETLDTALHDLDPYAPLVTGADIAAPGTGYDLVDPSVPDNWLADSSTSGSLAALARAALVEAGVTARVPAELQGLITADPATSTPGYTPDTYVVRTVFEHDPCVPVLSEPSKAFQLARAMDADAPARKIRIALPDISNLRAFKRGVAIEMPPGLKRLVDRVNPKMLGGGGLGDDPGVELGWICSFSIQIMWVLSFLVMFLFVIAFNFIFWWIAFIKICFPIPVPSSKPKHPAP